MEENIKILEELLQGARDNNMYEDNKYFKSIEKLINKCKEQESLIKMQQYRIEEMDIPKAKIQEIIENHYPDVACLKIQELIEEGEK